MALKLFHTKLGLIYQLPIARYLPDTRFSKFNHTKNNSCLRILNTKATHLFIATWNAKQPDTRLRFTRIYVVQWNLDGTG